VSHEIPAPILFYDGECGLCARSVQWCLKHDRRSIVRYAALQGATYRDLQLDKKPSSLDSVVLLDQGVLLERSDALLGILRHFGGIWPLLGAMGRLVPRVLRDCGYRFIARRRLAWFGDASTCRLPRSSEHARFLP
jgi:predicted DCC family thiol-disulfide oxidoreductase YuxK